MPSVGVEATCQVFFQQSRQAKPALPISKTKFLPKLIRQLSKTASERETMFRQKRKEIFVARLRLCLRKIAPRKGALADGGRSVRDSSLPIELFRDAKSSTIAAGSFGMVKAEALRLQRHVLRPAGHTGQTGTENEVRPENCC